MDTIQLILAYIFDFFKAKNPTTAALILSVLVIVAYNFNAIATTFGVTNGTFLEVLKWINFILIAVTGARTAKDISESTNN